MSAPSEGRTEGRVAARLSEADAGASHSAREEQGGRGMSAAMSSRADPLALPPRARLDAYARLTRLDKPIGTLLLLWPTLSALWIATAGAPSWIVIGIFTLGTLLMRSAGCAINDYADRDFDAHVQCTAGRPLAKREIAPWEAL